MFVASLLLAALGVGLVVASALVGSDDLALGAIAAALAAGGLLAVGVARHRPGRGAPATPPAWRVEGDAEDLGGSADAVDPAYGEGDLEAPAGAEPAEDADRAARSNGWAR